MYILNRSFQTLQVLQLITSKYNVGTEFNVNTSKTKYIVVFVSEMKRVFYTLCVLSNSYVTNKLGNMIYKEMFINTIVYDNVRIGNKGIQR